MFYTINKAAYLVFYLLESRGWPGQSPGLAGLGPRLARRFESQSRPAKPKPGLSD